MLHNVYIFRDNGVCLFSRKYGSIETDEGLVSSFLSAITHFGKELGTRSLERLDFGNYCIILVDSGDNLITAGVIDKNDDVHEMERALNVLIYNFKNNYANYANLNDIVNEKDLLAFTKTADNILKYATSHKTIIVHATNLARVVKQLRNKLAVILEAIANGKPVIVCAERREDAEIYVHTLNTLRSQLDVIPWTEDENIIFSIKERKNILVGVPIRYVMRLAEYDEITILNLTHFRVHGKLRSTKKWKDAAKYATKHIEELGEDAIYTFIQSLMESFT
ncbi:MAG: hypothetical protein ACFFA5_08765 [Promethearchaeota archaeon]